MKKITIEIDENTRGGKILERGLEGLTEVMLALDNCEINFCKYYELCQAEVVTQNEISRWRCRKCLEEWLNSPDEEEKEEEKEEKEKK